MSNLSVIPDQDLAPPGSAMMAVEQSRAIQEAQAAFVVAKQFPRDEIRAQERAVEACKRYGLARQGQYAYSRGSSQITGPSIRLAETIARYWGNLQYGIRELSQGRGYSEMEAFCSDMESNVRATRVFHVPHSRHTKKGSRPLTDPRDIYENNANQGARRLRACILEVIPGDVVEAAVEQCEKTLAGSSEKPLIDRIKAMVEVFAQLGVSKNQLEERAQKRLDALLETDLVRFVQIYNSLKDGMSKPEDWFDTPSAPKAATDLQDRLKAKPEPTHEPEPEPDAEPEPEPDADLPDFSRTDVTIMRAGNWRSTCEKLRNQVGEAGLDWHEVATQMLDSIGMETLGDVPGQSRKDFASAVQASLEDQ